MARPLVESVGVELGTSPGPEKNVPEPDADGSVRPMNNPLELTGRVRRLSRTAPGRVLIVGAHRDRRRLARCLGQSPWAGLPVVGFIDAGHPRYSGGLGRGRQRAVHPRTDPVPVLGGIDRLVELVDRSGATHVVVAVSGRPAKRIRPRIARLSNTDVAVHWIIDEAEPAVALPVEAETDATDRPSAGPLQWDRVAKRAVDFVGSALGLVLLAPLFLVVSLLILLTSGRPIFYLQDRVGQGGRIFRMIKFRSMRRDAEGKTGPIWASDHDSRCTWIGDWLRHTNIDELPQLVNVLRGEMSLVGPRPERPIFVERFRETVPDYDLRHAVPGGMTGWAQVHGWRGRTSLRKRIQYDLDYIQRWSFWLDFRVLVMTVQHVFWGKISWSGGPKRRPER
jgi:exopolysaccharide biosynthesis polyprenyl glycosylphosphotransferase